MTEDPRSSHAPEDADDETDVDSDVRSLIRGALAADAGEAAPDVLSGVQQKLRERSGGKFYDDTWSTARQAPTLTFLVTSTIMLVVVLVTWAVLAPLSGRAEPVRTEPSPIDVLPTLR